MSYHIFHYRLKKLKRAFLIWITLISLLIKLWIDNIRFSIFQTKSNEKSRVQIKRARWFTNKLIELGSAFIKIGQLLSARPDLIPNTWIQELSKLQDQVPQFSYKKVEEIIKKELQSILNLYAKMVSNGSWKDYSFTSGIKEVSFDVYQRASEKPVLRITKNFRPKYFNEKFFIKDRNGNILRKSENLNNLISKTSWNKLRLIK